MEKDGIFTMEQFKEIYDKAVAKTIESMNKIYHEKKEDVDSMGELFWSLHNMLAFQELRKEIFKDEESE